MPLKFCLKSLRMKVIMFYTKVKVKWISPRSVRFRNCEMDVVRRTAHGYNLC